MKTRNSHPRTPRIVVEQALKAYDAGEKAASIAARCGVHPSTVFYWAKNRRIYSIPSSSDSELMKSFLYGK